MMIWKAIHPKATFDMLGYIPGFLKEDDPRKASEQIDDRYISGWDPLPKFRFNPEELTLKYPGDPPIRALYETTLRDERIIFFEHSWVAIVQKDGSYEVARLD